MTTVYGSNNTTHPMNESDSRSKQVNKSLGQDEFLKLLVAQLKNQDPMSPMQDADFIAQLAQFSALEQMTKMSASIEILSANMTMLYSQSLLTQGAALIGKDAVGINGTGQEVTGRITSVSWLNGSLVVMVGDTLLSLDSIMEIMEPGTAASSVDNSPEEVVEETDGENTDSEQDSSL